MINYENMRRNMVLGQLQTNGIVDEAILDAFKTVPREAFLPEQLRGVAYVDEDIVLPGGGFAVEPMVLAKMLSAARAPGADVAFCIGDVTGYVGAVLSQMVTTVVTLESKARQMDTARDAWISFDMCNIAIARGSVRRGCPEHAPYDVVVICGAVDEVPDDVLRQLASGGRLVTVIREKDSVICQMPQLFSLMILKRKRLLFFRKRLQCVLNMY